MSARLALLSLLCLALLTPVAAQVGAPPVPTNLTATLKAGPAVDLKWDAPSGLWAYKIYRSIGDAGSMQPIGISPLAKSYTDDGVAPGKKHYYAVSAMTLGTGGATQESERSAVVEISVPVDATKGVLEGKVTDENTGNGVPWVQIQIYVAGSDLSTWTQVLTDMTGHYQVTLDPGSYLIHAVPPYSSVNNWADEWYDNAGSSGAATPLALAGGATVTANIALGGKSATARVQIIHNAADPAAAKVDVYVNGSKLLDDFGFRKATPFVSVPAGVALNVGIAPANSTSVGDTIRNFVVTLDDGGVYVAVANGVIAPAGFTANPDGKSIGLTLFLKSGAQLSAPAGNVALAALHGATDAPTVDVAARGVGTLVNNAMYGDITPYFTVPAASYILDVTDASGATTVASFLADLGGLGGRAAFVFASGFLTPPAGGAAFGLYAALTNGTVIALPPFASGATGLFSGTVTDAVNGDSLANVKVMFFKQNASSTPAFWALTGKDGRYLIAVDTGAYLIKAEPPHVGPGATQYLAEWYENAATPAEAKTVAIAATEAITINFGLAKVTPPAPVMVSGVVKDDGGVSLAGATVVLMRTIQSMTTLSASSALLPALTAETQVVDGVGECIGVVWKGKSDSTGVWSAQVPGNSSYIALAVKAGYIPEYYDNKTNPVLADQIPVGTTPVTGIDFSLSAVPVQLNSIAGVVKDVNGTGVASRIVLIPKAGMPVGLRARLGATDADGAYMIDHVPAGSYYVMAIPWHGYAPAFYKKDAFGVIHWKDADPVDVTGAVSGIDIGVKKISGWGLARLIGKALTPGGAALNGVNLFATGASGEILGYGLTDATGAYAMEGVPQGAVTLTSDRDGYDGSTTALSIPSTSFEVHTDMTLTPTSTVDVPVDNVIPSAYTLAQNYPNPFNPSTTIEFALPQDARVRLEVFNVLGARVASLADADFRTGVHRIVWDARTGNGVMLASGVYYYQIRTTAVDGRTTYLATKAMLLVR